MKAVVKAVEPVDPPKVLFLELSELEARALYWSMDTDHARANYREIGSDDEDEAATVAFGIELAIDRAFDVEGLCLDANDD